LPASSHNDRLGEPNATPHKLVDIARRILEDETSPIIRGVLIGDLRGLRGQRHRDGLH
jgi:hypothetical protein